MSDVKLNLPPREVLARHHRHGRIEQADVDPLKATPSITPSLVSPALKQTTGESMRRSSAARHAQLDASSQN